MSGKETLGLKRLPESISNAHGLKIKTYKYATEKHLFETVNNSMVHQQKSQPKATPIRY
jgi:hypothetical protein